MQKEKKNVFGIVEFASYAKCAFCSCLSISIRFSVDVVVVLFLRMLDKIGSKYFCVPHCIYGLDRSVAINEMVIN